MFIKLWYLLLYKLALSNFFILTRKAYIVGAETESDITNSRVLQSFLIRKGLNDEKFLKKLVELHIDSCEKFVKNVQHQASLGRLNSVLDIPGRLLLKPFTNPSSFQ
eukprot:Pgem_evm1s5616